MEKSKHVLSHELIESARAHHFPMILGESFMVKLVSPSQIDEIFKQYRGEVFPTLARHPRFEVPEPRKERVSDLRQYFSDHGHRDHLILEKDGEVCGWFFGEQSDSSTYYLRNAGLLPAFQKQGLAREFLPKFLSYLKDIGYERVTSQHKGHNVAVLISMLKAGFVLAGLEFDERWGHLFKMVRQLNDDRMNAFQEMFW